MDAIDWSKSFSIATINRADLTEFGFTDEQIATIFTDEVMRQIADEMQSSYHLHHPFWTDFAIAIKTVLGFEVQKGEEMNSTDWSKKFEVLSISRLYLHHTLGFSKESVEALTDEDMSRIADTLQENVLHAAQMHFDEEVRFIVACEIVEQQSTGGQP